MVLPIGNVPTAWMVVVQRQPDLLQVVDALGTTGRLAGRLNRRQQQGDEHRNDRDHHEQFDQGKTATTQCHDVRPRREYEEWKKSAILMETRTNEFVFSLMRMSSDRTAGLPRGRITINDEPGSPLRSPVKARSNCRAFSRHGRHTGEHPDHFDLAFGLVFPCMNSFMPS